MSGEQEYAEPEDDGDDLREEAGKTLGRCQDSWTSFRENTGLLLDTHVSRTFGYFQGILSDDSKPTDWVKDGVALWIGCYRTGRGLWDEACKLVCPKE